MNKIILAILLCLTTLSACTSIKEGLTGTKKDGVDEFLVKKKAPLVLPPNFGELPEPGKKTDKNITSTEKDTSNIEEIINQSSLTEKSKKKDDSNSSIEKSIIEKIIKKKIKDTNLNEAKGIKKEKPKKKNFFKRLREKFNK